MRERGPFMCQQCGIEYFTRRPKGEGEKFHSRECSFAFKVGPNHHNYLPPELHKNYRPMIERSCVICGHSTTNPKCCSDECRAEEARRYSRDRSSERKDMIERPCLYCGRRFTPKYGNKRRVYCSPGCQKQATGLILLNTPEAKRFHKLLRRSRLRLGNLPIEFNPLPIFERDQWTCEICHSAVDKDSIVPEPFAPTIDHKIPLMRGGHHSFDNVQCAHFICNVRKGGGYATLNL